MSSCFLHKSRFALVKKKVVSRPVWFTGRPVWRGKIKVNLRSVSAAVTVLQEAPIIDSRHLDEICYRIVIVSDISV